MRDLMSRRDLVSLALGSGLVLSVERSAGARAPAATPVLDTTAGKVRGLQRQGIARFLGIRYGADTGAHRFQPPRAPEPWIGVKDCMEYGAQAPQGNVRVSDTPTGASGEPSSLSPDSAAGAVLAVAKDSVSRGPESEDCLFLNVYTPDASAARKRPVMVWLHGGGFTMGSGGIPSTDGDELARFGDVVVVSLNHRLGAPGYLYLGALHDDFADSGNTGHLDIVLALQWVRDNIGNLGGDARNVTIFGQSGGGWKVGAMLAMPPGRGLFHKAIEQSGPAVRMYTRDDAAALTERTLAELGITRGDVHKMQSLQVSAIVQAVTKVQTSNALSGRRELGPTVDGRTLSAQPFDPVATDVSRHIPLMIGCTKDETTMFLAFDPLFGRMGAEQARQRFNTMAGTRAALAFELYSKRRPSDPPTYWVTAFQTDEAMWSGSIIEAERKSAQNAAPVFLYRVDFGTSLANGALRATHGTEMPFVFRKLDGFGKMDGEGPAARMLMEKVSQAWINFARHGSPSQTGLDWPRYDATHRRTMIIDSHMRVESDPDRDIREFWSS